MNNIKIKKVSQNKEFLVALAIILICILLSLSFPSKNSFQGLTKGFFFLFIVPILYIKLVLKKNVADFGLNIQNKMKGFVWGSLMLVLSLIIAYLFIKYTPFVSNYYIPPLLSGNFWAFSVNMLIFVNLVLFFQEYFFRGFTLSVFSQKINAWSILVQAGLYFFIILFAQSGFKQELWQSMPFIILSITGGIIAYKSKSMIYSYISGFLFLIMLNSYLIQIIKTK